MKKIILVYFFSMMLSSNLFSQESDIGFSYGRFYAVYKSIDYGTGFRNSASSQYARFPSLTYNRYFSRSISGEIRASYTQYQQYASTRLYFPSFYSIYHGGNFSFTANYSFLKSKVFEARIKLGIGIGIVPDLYKGEWIEMFVFESNLLDSISRGYITRDFAAVFPTLSTGLDFSYQVSPRYKIALAASYQKGFTKITEYEIYYNDGSGNNDQRAKQWGTGDFYGIQLGVRYLLREKKGQKPGKK